MGGTSSKPSSSRSANDRPAAPKSIVAKSAAARPAIAATSHPAFFPEKKPTVAKLEKATIPLKGDPIKLEIKCPNFTLGIITIEGLGKENSYEDLKNKIAQQTDIPVERQHIPILDLLLAGGKKLGEIDQGKYSHPFQMTKQPVTNSSSSSVSP